MVKKVEVKVPKYESVQVGEEIVTKWVTSDGESFDDERSAERHEFYECKINHRGHNLTVNSVEIFDLTCVEDLERYEKDYLYNAHIYNTHIKKYDKNLMVFPNTYVMYEIDDPNWIPNPV